MCTHTRHIYIYIHIYIVNTHAHIYIDEHMYTWACVCKHLDTRVHTQSYMYVFMCAYVHIYERCKFISISESVLSVYNHPLQCILNAKALGCLHNSFYFLLINSQNLYEGLEVLKMGYFSS